MGCGIHQLSASITGVPKVRATEIIAGIETTARGVCTGCIGYIARGRRAQFGVANIVVELDGKMLTPPVN